MLSLQNLSVRAGIKLLFQGATLNVHPGQKIGLIGQNGTGKTSLFKTILGELPIDEGQVAIPANWLIGSVEQEVKALNLNALDYVCFGDTKYAEAQQMIATSEQSQDHDAMVQAYDVLDKIDGFAVPNNARQLLYGLGFEATDFEKKISEFSKKKIRDSNGKLHSLETRPKKIISIEERVEQEPDRPQVYEFE